MNKIKELTAHIRRLAEKGYIVDYNTPNELNNALNQIDIFSELMNEVEVKLKEPNFYIVNSKKYLNDEQRISVAEKIRQMSTTHTWVQIKSEDDLPKDDKNVLVIIEGQMQIMCLCSIIDNDVYSKVWCMVYDGLDGDGIYDDNYYPTHWMPLPTHPPIHNHQINNNMTNTVENKQRFFDAYSGQKIFKYSWNEELYTNRYLDQDKLHKYKAELKPLSEISDDDAIEVANMAGVNDADIFRKEYFVGMVNDNFYLQINHNGYIHKNKSGELYHLHTIVITDYLRSRGYLLPFMDLTIEQILEYGWAVLK